MAVVDMSSSVSLSDLTVQEDSRGTSISDGQSVFSPVAAELLKENDVWKKEKYRRDTSKRVFVNRSLQMQKIKHIGFDMDYTLAGKLLLKIKSNYRSEYVSPAFENLAFGHIIERLISIGYPTEIRNFEYTQHFPVRGLWFDMEYGNLLKVDAYGNILVGLHGFKFMTPAEIESDYPNKFLHLTESRIYVLNTLFNVPETHLLASIINYFDKCAEGYQRTGDCRGVQRTNEEEVLTYRAIFQDVRAAVDWVHIKGSLKQVTVENLEKYVVKNDELGEMLQRLSTHHSLFLLTNSDWAYSNQIMTYMLGNDWANSFDLVVVDARKPLWFSDGTAFRQVDKVTGALKIGMHTGTLRKGSVYSGGSCDVFTRLVGARGKDVLYVGDHIFGDVLRSKKARGWRTMLIVPELERELRVWTEQWQLFEQLQALDVMMGEVYKDMDSRSTRAPNITKLTQAIREVTHSMDQSYGMLGSLFRSGSRTTFFASQVERYADLYTASCVNLLHYPHTYFFRAPPMLLPHESTVDHRTAPSGTGQPPGHIRNSNSSSSSVRLRSCSSVVQDAYNVINDYRPHFATNGAVASADRRRFERAHTPRMPTFVHEDEDGDADNPSPPLSMGSDVETSPNDTGSRQTSLDAPSTPANLALPHASRRMHKDSDRELLATHLNSMHSETGSEDVVTISKAVVDVGP